VKAGNTPESRLKFEDAGFAIIGNTPEEFAAMVRRDIETTEQVIKAAGIKPE
jgi:tripartite-type tricarboxylate transporter receptor subunit TctC